jgi:hypothetical protein
MKTLLHPIVAVVVCVTAAVCFTAAAGLHAVTPAEWSSVPDTGELSLSTSATAGHRAWSALDFWAP